MTRLLPFSINKVDPSGVVVAEPVATTLTLNAALPALEVATTVAAPRRDNALKATEALPSESVVTLIEVTAPVRVPALEV